MRIARFKTGADEKWGLIDGSRIVAIKENPYEEVNWLKLANTSYKLERVKLLAPSRPSKIVAVGLNYRDHAEELKMAIPDEPIIFLKPSTSVIGNGDDILLPQSSSRIDFEAELAVVIGRIAKNVKESEADRFVLGYTCGNDVTARDLQQKDGQWTRAKSFDTFNPLGPWVETELDCSNLEIELKLNGETKQKSSTAEMIFKIPELVSFISKIMTLLPGDVIMTGTPPGVGKMEPGGEVVVEIEGIGRLTNVAVKNREKG